MGGGEGIHHNVSLKEVGTVGIMCTHWYIWVGIMGKFDCFRKYFLKVLIHFSFL